MVKELIYKLLDVILLHRGIERSISGYKLRIPKRFFRYFEPDYELTNVNFIKENVKPGMIAIDAGAHIGLMSVIISKNCLGGKVFSFEPTPQTFHILEHCIKINGLRNLCFPINKSVSNQNG